MLADPTRLALMWALQDHERDVTALTAQVPASRSSVSQHLGRLRLAGLVEVRRDGRCMIYRARGEHVRRLVQEALLHADHDLSGEPVHD
jgi:DNA-binding transcriptional ArsR family regulator